MRSAALAVIALCFIPQALAQLGPPVETRRANAPQQTPAFEGQTRAPSSATLPPMEGAVVADDLPGLWAMEFLPNGRMLVTAKTGALHIVDRAGNLGPKIPGVPAVDARRQGGLLDVALSPDFATDGLVFLSFSEPRGRDGNGTSVARGRLEIGDGNAAILRDVSVILRQTPSYRGTMHYGSRLAFAPDGTLFVTTGERSDRGVRGQSQDLLSGLGKIFRINPDGSVPANNPFVGDSAALPEIWSYGHRNLQSAVVTAAGDLWTVEHGPRGGDELNRPLAGRNYGWPIITYGINYSGTEVGRGITAQAGMEQPIYYWDPVIAPSGMAEYVGDEFPEFSGALLVGGLAGQVVAVLHVEGDRVAREDRIPLPGRIRDVKVGPDGAIYVVTDGRGAPSRILRITRAPTG
ncbi:MAG: PQQ-dependent sugar dehydrogenase [Pseudomonadota bacterium]